MQSIFNHVRCNVHRVQLTSASFLTRGKHLKSPSERLPAFVRYEKPQLPEVNEQSQYDDQEKLRLWKQIRPSELRPPFFEFNQQERAYLGLDTVEDVAYLPEVKRTKPVTAFPDEQPFNEIYANGKDEGNFTGVQNLLTEQPERWFWVERLMPKPLARRLTQEELVDCPSGFVAPPPPSSASSSHVLPYFVARTRNNLLPVYKQVDYQDQLAKTLIRKVTGDIWALEEELRSVVQPLQEERILSSVNESNGEIKFLGSWEKQVADHLIKLGF